MHKYQVHWSTRKTNFILFLTKFCFTLKKVHEIKKVKILKILIFICFANFHLSILYFICYENIVLLQLILIMIHPSANNFADIHDNIMFKIPQCNDYVYNVFPLSLALTEGALFLAHCWGDEWAPCNHWLCFLLFYIALYVANTPNTVIILTRRDEYYCNLIFFFICNINDSELFEVLLFKLFQSINNTNSLTTSA